MPACRQVTKFSDEIANQEEKINQLIKISLEALTRSEKLRKTQLG